MKALNINYNYESYYGNGRYETNIDIPLELLQKYATIDLSTERNQDYLVSLIRREGTLPLGEIEGKHSFVELIGEHGDFEVEISNGNQTILDDKGYDIVPEMLIGVFDAAKILNSEKTLLDLHTDISNIAYNARQYSVASAETVTVYFETADEAYYKFKQLIEKNNTQVTLRY